MNSARAEQPQQPQHAAASLLDTTTRRMKNGCQLRFARLGSGPPIVMLHGYPENLQVWSRLAPRLATDYEVIAIDWPGMGDSDQWPGGATPQIKARRLRTILDELGIERPTLLAMDMGAQPALAYAAQMPEAVSRLVVMNSLAFGDLATSWEIRWLRKFGFNRLAIRRFPKIVFRRAESTFLPRGVRLDANLRGEFWRTFSRPEVLRFVSKMCAGYQGTLAQLPALYEQIKCPTLVLWAEHDKHFPLVQGQRLHETIPGSQFAMVPGGTHWMVIDQADTVAKIIRNNW